MLTPRYLPFLPSLLGVLSLRWRLFDFGRVDAQIAAARGREAEARAAYRLAVLRATEEVNRYEARPPRRVQVRWVTPLGEETASIS